MSTVTWLRFKRVCSKRWFRIAHSIAEVFQFLTESRSACSSNATETRIGWVLGTISATGSSVPLDLGRCAFTWAVDKAVGLLRCAASPASRRRYIANSNRKRKARCCNHGMPMAANIDTTALNIPIQIRERDWIDRLPSCGRPKARRQYDRGQDEAGRAQSLGTAAPRPPQGRACAVRAWTREVSHRHTSNGERIAPGGLQRIG
jgi:hypothetical protein